MAPGCTFNSLARATMPQSKFFISSKFGSISNSSIISSRQIRQKSWTYFRCCLRDTQLCSSSISSYFHFWQTGFLIVLKFIFGRKLQYGNFQRMKDFSNSLARNFDFSAGKTSLTLTTFHDTAEVVLGNETDQDLIQVRCVIRPKT